MVTSTIIRNCAKRIPSIKFRKGGPATTSHQNATSTNHPANSRAASGQAIEDWQLPERYRRRLIDEKECDYINRGGPE